MEQIKNQAFTYMILEGNELSYAPLGNINNIDVRQLNDQVFVTATNRSIQAIEYWVFNQDDFFEAKQSC